MLDSHIRLEGAPNFRDLGGYRAVDGRPVRRGYLFRSETLSALTDADFRQLAALGVRLVCDLRSLHEVKRRPTRWPSQMKPETLMMNIEVDLRSGDSRLVDILRQDPTEQGAIRMMLRIYHAIPGALLGYLHGMFVRLADGKNVPLIMHCSAGKDRTGVLAAVILLALGVSREDVYHDYRLTDSFRDIARLEENIVDVTTFMLGMEPGRGVVSAMAAVRDAYLDAALEVIERDFGSVKNYLAAAGIDANLLKRMRKNLLED